MRTRTDTLYTSTGAADSPGLYEGVDGSQCGAAPDEKDIEALRTYLGESSAVDADELACAVIAEATER